MAANRNQDNDPDPGWYYCTKHDRVEHGTRCRAQDLLGPYPDEQTAARALEIAAERTRNWDRADHDWDDDAGPPSGPPLRD